MLNSCLKLVGTPGTRGRSLNFLFRYCSWWNSAKLPRQITTLTTLFPSNVSSNSQQSLSGPKCIFPILLKVSQQFSLSTFRTKKVGPIFTPCFAWIIAFSLEIAHCSKSSFFVQKFNFDFPRKLSIFLGWIEKLVKMLCFCTS